MPVHPIRIFGDPVLRTQADPVRQFDEALLVLVDDMLETMDANSGAGLAAPQIGVLQRVFVYSCNGERGHLVNPKWVPLGTETEVKAEGCLSIPELSLPTERYTTVRVTGFSAAQEAIEFDATGLLARAVQHETDHLDGVLFLQRLEPEIRRKAMAEIRASQWFGNPSSQPPTTSAVDPVLDVG